MEERTIAEELVGISALSRKFAEVATPKRCNQKTT